MPLQRIYKTSIALLMLITSTFVFAKTDNQIPCPSPTTVRLGALILNNYQPSVQYNNAYFVGSDAPAFQE